MTMDLPQMDAWPGFPLFKPMWSAGWSHPCYALTTSCASWNTPWSPNIYHAYQIMSDVFRHASEVLLQEADTIHLKLHVETLTNNVIPIFMALEAHTEEEQLPVQWLYSCTEVVGALIVKLCQAQETANGWYVIHQRKWWFWWCLPRSY